MTPTPRNRAVSHPAMRAGLTAAIVVTLLGMLVVLGPSVAAWPGSPTDPVSWSNGTVLCQFASSAPSVAVSRAALTGTGVTVSVISVVEVAANGATVASADLSGLPWSVGNWSTDDFFDLAYVIEAPVVGASDPSGSVGTANVTVQFVLPAYAESGTGPMNVVTAAFSVSQWPWQGTNDHLVLALAASPTFPSAEHLNVTSASGWLVSSTSNSSGAVLEQVGGSPQAVATASNGTVRNVTANASLVLPSPSWAQITVDFGSAAGAFSSLEYSAHVGVVLPSTVAGIPLYEFAEAGTAAALVTVLVALVARRVRRRPSKLIYAVSEEGT